MASQLPEVQALAAAIAENSVQGIVVMDASGYGLYANRAWTEITGFTFQEMEGRRVHDCVHHRHPGGQPFPIDECPIGCTLGRSENVRNHRDLFFRKDGTSFHVVCAASMLQLGDGAVLKILEIRDATEEVEIARHRDEFLAMLAHELRNPLAPIAAAAELLKLGRHDPDVVQRTSAVIARQVDHMSGLVDDLLDVSRVTRGLIELEKENLDLRGVVGEAIEQVRPLIEARGHALDLRTGLDAAIVFGDRKRLVQVLSNVLGNAIKYTAPGGRIAVAIELDADTVRASVCDNGIGMSADTIAQAFELFSQAQRTPDRSQGGLGIGLALVRSLVGLHGGAVEIRSEGLGKGTTVAIVLPRFASRSIDAAPAASVPAAARDGRLRIMVVDDNHDAAETLGMLLEALGHEVVLAYGSRQAVEIAAGSTQDVFLLDIGLPDMDGTDLARALRAQPRHRDAMLVAVTGYGQERDRHNTRDAGFDHHLMKPVHIDEINAVLPRGGRG